MEEVEALADGLIETASGLLYDVWDGVDALADSAAKLVEGLPDDRGDSLCNRLRDGGDDHAEFRQHRRAGGATEAVAHEVDELLELRAEAGELAPHV